MKYNCKIIIFYSFRRAKIVFKSKIIRKKDKIFCSKIYIYYWLNFKMTYMVIISLILTCFFNFELLVLNPTLNNLYLLNEIM